VVNTRATVQHGIDVRKLEPLGPGLRPWLAHNLYTLIHDAVRACGAAEFPLQAKGEESGITADEVRQSARFTAANVRAVATLLRDPRAEVSVPAAVFISVPGTPSVGDGLDGVADDTKYLLGIAERESSAALALVAQRPARTGGVG
jgi:hypothetical protein